jgi:tetratricopeptide (TPR) repeat protein
MTALTVPLLALGYYLKLLLIPYPLNLYPAALTVGNAQGVLYLIVGIGGAVGLFWIIVRRHRTLGAIGAVWLISGLVAPLIVPLVRVSATPVAERYAYLASVGFLLMVGVGAVEGWNRVKERLNGKLHVRWVIGFVGLMVGSFSLLTMDRNTVWQNEATLWKDTIQKSPRAAMPHNNLGTIYTTQKRLDDAEREFKIAIQLKPDYLTAYHNLGVAYEQHHRWEEAIRTFQTALTL